MTVVTAIKSEKRIALATALVLLAWATLFCTAMIYASLKPIRQWHTWRVPLNYLLLGHATGALLLRRFLNAPQARSLSHSGRRSKACTSGRRR